MTTPEQAKTKPTRSPETLDALPGEGETRTRVEIQRRRECEECGEPAHFKLSFIFKGARSNPNSSAYGRDDCSWCSDHDTWACREHRQSVERAEEATGEWAWSAATVPATERWAHMFLYWAEVK